MPTISTSIEIAASPEKVRQIFLDFASWPEWSHAHFKKVVVASGKAPSTLTKGDKLNVEINEMKFSPIVQINEPGEFRWTGSLPGIFTGTHIFRFTPSTVTPGGTTLGHGEEFSGALSFLIGPNRKWGQQSKESFEGFNREFKARVEGSS